MHFESLRIKIVTYVFGSFISEIKLEIITYLIGAVETFIKYF